MSVFSEFTFLLFSYFSFLVQAAPHHGRSINSPYATSSHTIDLKAIPGVSNPSSRSLHCDRRRSASLANQTAPLINLDASFAAPVKISDQSFYLVVDTGSADTWVPDVFFTCLYGEIGPWASPTSQDECAFGTYFDRDNSDLMFNVTPNSNFYASYADGSGAGGLLGQTSLKLASSLTVPNQQVGVATIASWKGDNITSGILGLAYSPLTSKYPGTNIWDDKQCPFINSSNRYLPSDYKCNQETYPALIETLFQSSNNSGPQLQEKAFSIALSRDHSNNFNGGTLTFGGIPELSLPTVNVSSPFTTTPVEALGSSHDKELRFYTLSVDGFLFPPTAPGLYNTTSSTAASQMRRDFVKSRRSQRSSSSTMDVMHPTTSGGQKAQFILDSGTTLTYIPDALAAAFNSLFEPPAYQDFHTTGSLWALDCENLSYVPSLGVSIAGEVFYHNPEDLVYKLKGQEYNYDIDEWVDTQYCISAVQDYGLSDNGVGILGQPFLKNVIAVFDIGRSELGLAARPYYHS
ncbi:hypothetical protein H2198_001925 [Neophaeococcomyces mojaviensis]|uniref:Uncharacterized protein n=1 Tax=Neophaeococcomyces mojaviensis TaxID=3383035 RepID=A0ACC3AG89_9EURO|nr:hypothetical protein H2198_001925 [Knufia sp. JES_112]